MTELLDFKLLVAKWIAQVGVIDETQARLGGLLQRRLLQHSKLAARPPGVGRVAVDVFSLQLLTQPRVRTQATPHPTQASRVILDAAASAALRGGKARLAHCSVLL